MDWNIRRRVCSARKGQKLVESLGARVSDLRSSVMRMDLGKARHPHYSHLWCHWHRTEQSTSSGCLHDLCLSILFSIGFGADQRLCYYSAPAHGARATVEYLRQATPDFISPDVWPPNCTDLNPVDCRIWGCLKDHVYQKRSRDINELKQLVDVWSDFGQTVIDGLSMRGEIGFRPVSV